jgi:glycosyltransferase involved in cell wall biosynthesis
MMVVADDGSTDGTVDFLKSEDIPHVTGMNMGIAWNKNRALFLLAQVMRCQTVILLEDDTRPTRDGWEEEWIEVTQRWGHANFAPLWFDQFYVGGNRTIESPAHYKMLTAQCSAYSAECLSYGGYFDTRFRGYGHEHVEHSRRLVRVGYGGTEKHLNGRIEVTFIMLKNSLEVIPCRSHNDLVQSAQNETLAQDLINQEGFRAPWGNDVEMRQFRREMGIATSTGSDHLLIHRPIGSYGYASPVRPNLLSRLFERRR